MLSNTWPEKRHDARLRINLFRDLSRIILSITRIPLPKIGSFTIDQDGFLSLTNRPLSNGIHELENEGGPTNIPRDYTYNSVDTYVMDMLGIHDSRIRNQPNAINDTGDYIYQMSALTTMRTVFSSFFTRDLRHGPFVFSFTDLHQSNIFVDNDWHITALVDLELACTRPIGMYRTPSWLTSMAVDILAKEPTEYVVAQKEFLDILTAEEENLSCPTSSDIHHGSRPQLSAVMKRTWDTGTFWYSLALASPTGLFTLFYKQIQPRFLEYSPEHEGFQNIMPWYWRRDYVRLGLRKIADREAYDAQLRKAFEDGPCN
jgi:hypothetical protein